MCLRSPRASPLERKDSQCLKKKIYFFSSPRREEEKWDPVKPMPRNAPNTEKAILFARKGVRKKSLRWKGGKESHNSGK